MPAFKLQWKGPQVVRECEHLTAMAMGDIGDLVVTLARRRLYPGHGYRTGNLWRSLYWRLAVAGGHINLEFGSPLFYAWWVHQGHHSFPGYHFFWEAMQEAKPQTSAILGRYSL